MHKATDLHQLAGLYAGALEQHLFNAPCIIAGVGLYTMAALELSTQLHHMGRHVDLLHVWCSLYQLILESVSSQPLQQQQQQQRLPELADMLRHLYSLQSYEAQLDFVSTLCPAGMEAHVWDNRVHETLSQVLHLMQLLHSYQPRERLPCPAVLVHKQEVRHLQQDPMRVTELLGRVADDSWRQVAPALLPITACSMTASAGSGISHDAIASAVGTAIRGAVRSSAVSNFGSMDQQEVSSSTAQLDAAVIPLNKLCPDNRWELASA